MTDTIAPTLPADLAEIAGPVATDEYAGAGDAHKPGLVKWLVRLPELSDDDFRGETASAIHGSALVSSWRGNWEHEHFKASACSWESRRRHIAAGHDKDCRGDSLYSQGFLIAWRSQGHDPSAYPVRPCTCGRAA